MTLSVDMTSKKVAPFHDSVLRLLERMKTAHASLPRPNSAGRSVRMPDKR
jgi:acyl-CoA thioester hydrolase